MLHQKVKETELAAEKDRYLREKVSEDMTSLIRENSSLNQQILELSKQLDRVCALVLITSLVGWL